MGRKIGKIGKIGKIIIMILVISFVVKACGLVKDINNPNSRRMTPSEYFNTLIFQESYQHHIKNNKR